MLLASRVDCVKQARDTSATPFACKFHSTVNGCAILTLSACYDYRVNTLFPLPDHANIIKWKPTSPAPRYTASFLPSRLRLFQARDVSLDAADRGG